MKRILTVLFFVFLFSSFTADSFAHSGRTDANGGHYDHATGEYHYHHGHPAHQHTDLDGDGVPDCPYNFVDNTNHSSGSSSSSKSYPFSETRKTTTVEVPRETVNNDYDAIAYIVMLAPVGIYAYVMLKNKREEKEMEERERRKLLEEERNTRLYGNVPKALTSGTGTFSYAVTDRILTNLGANQGERSEEQIAFFVTSSGKCYHKRTCKYLDGKYYRKINAADIRKYGYHPCSKCNPALPPGQKR